MTPCANVPAAEDRVRLDLNSPVFQDVVFRLGAEDLKQVVSALGRVRELDWNALYRHTGFRREAIEHLNVAGGRKVYSPRLHLTNAEMDVGEKRETHRIVGLSEKRSEP